MKEEILYHGGRDQGEAGILKFGGYLTNEYRGVTQW